MRFDTRVAAPNSLVLVGDTSSRTIPASLSGGIVAASRDMVAVGTRSAPDGDTAVTLGDDLGRTVSGLTEVFDGFLATPSMSLVVMTVHLDVLLRISTATDFTRVRIWVNDDEEPDIVQIAVGEGVEDARPD